MRKYRLKEQFDPCVVMFSDPQIIISNTPVGAWQGYDDALCERMLANGHRPDIFDIIPDQFLPTKTKSNSDKEVLTDQFLQIYQIFYDDKSFKDVNKNSIGYNNAGKETVFFENTAIVDILLNAPASQYVGVFSHKFYQKMPHTITYDWIYNEIKNTMFDVYPFHPQMGGAHAHNVVRLASNYHPGYIECFKYVCHKIGLHYHEAANRCHVYSQHFIAKRHVYLMFLEEVLIPALAVMSDPTETELQTLLWKDSGYMKDNPASLRNMQAKFGINYYPMHTFILERMFTMWMDTRVNLTFKSLWR